MRAVYDEIKGYSVTGDNPFFSTKLERDHVFVDEFTCIGEKNCMLLLQLLPLLAEGTG